MRSIPRITVAFVVSWAVAGAVFGVAAVEADRGSSAAARPRARLAAALFDVRERERVPTGILYDRVLPISRIENCTGAPGSRPVTAARWRQIYHEIYRASFDPSWPSLDEVLSRAGDSMDRGVVPIAVMNFRYNRIRSEALEGGSLRIVDGLLEPGPEGLYAEERVFAAAALGDRTYRGRDVVFGLDRRLLFGNEGSLPGRIEIDFDDGLGFRKAELGDTFPVRYSSTGSKVIRVRIHVRDDLTLQSDALFLVQALESPTPHDTLAVTALIPYNGEYGAGEAYVYLSDLHASLVNPVVIVEGFDIDNSMGWDELYFYLNQQEMVETLRAEGFDLVLLDFADATDYIQKNSFVIVELLQQVQDLVPPTENLALIGASMGGLCGRYALAYMESEGIGHRVRTFISFDSPQKGANIPLGVQYWVDFFSEQSESAAGMLASLDRPASRQMLVYHHTDPPGATGESDPLRTGLIADLAGMGDYPTEPRLVAVANGSGVMADQGFAPGEQIILYEYSSFVVDITGNVWAVPDGTGQIIFDGLIDMIWPLPDDQMAVTVSGTLPYDCAPGGSRSSMAQMDSTEAPYGDIIALHQSHCFIPTVSALAIETGDLFYDIAGDPDILSLTPFDAVYFPSVNEEHMTITAESAQWFLSEVRLGVTGEEGGDAGPPAAVLYQNFPNPFNPSTTIRFELPTAGRVRLEIFSVDGRLAVRLIDRVMPAGRHSARWDGRDEAGRPVASGMYFCRLDAGGRVITRKIVLVR